MINHSLLISGGCCFDALAAKPGAVRFPSKRTALLIKRSRPS